jgi:hypothetical protein
MEESKRQQNSNLKLSQSFKCKRSRERAVLKVVW